MDPPKDSQEVEIKTTETNARYLAYLARVRNIAFLLGNSARYLAYTSDVGEAFRPVIPTRVVQAAYAISWAYVITDVGIEGYREHNRGGSNTEVSRTVLERAIFQSAASMILPALTIHTTVHTFGKVFQRVGRWQRWGPTFAGLAVVPFLPFMFDHPVEWVLEKSFNTMWPTEKHHSEKHKKE